MKTLLSLNWEIKYYEYVNQLKFDDEELKKDFLELLQINEPLKREERWQKLKIRISNLKEASKLANPYYLGFGNPESDVLFIGKEKAFDIDKSPNLFLKERTN